MRPQELYNQVGMTHEGLSGIVDQVRQLVASAEVWDPASLTVDDSTVITPSESVDAVTSELRAFSSLGRHSPLIPMPAVQL